MPFIGHHPWRILSLPLSEPVLLSRLFLDKLLSQTFLLKIDVAPNNPRLTHDCKQNTLADDRLVCYFIPHMALISIVPAVKGETTAEELKEQLGSRLM